jgi:hypothetical protein
MESEPVKRIEPKSPGLHDESPKPAPFGPRRRREGHCQALRDLAYLSSPRV